ncbi:alpha/beta fold hydrolase [Kineococcus sp. R8]|uniref:alpha/beta fold hydrolase n=1 Tax=Kineococcus siccus TaxID=2696567 RepID=UPI0014132A6D|nr:alpha/beta hydrolase [Kineococcus siccus]NAZ82357.1 alpha/beta fold hydrolase [Kineococcus siccus]
MTVDDLATIAAATAAQRHHVTQHGRPDGRPVVFLHGFGSTQEMWHRVVPAFTPQHRVVLLDQAGAGSADPAAYDRARHSSLDGYAADLLDVCTELDLQDVVVVAHSVGSMVAARAAVAAQGRITQLVMLAPSARYVDDPAEGYEGGFAREDIDELLDSLDHNYVAWTAAVAPMVMGTPDRPELGEELTRSFRQTDPDTARDFARVTFLSDSRDVLAHVATPTLVLQCRHDALAPAPAVRRVHTGIAGSVLVELEAVGHCPHVSAPEETAAVVLAHLGRAS